MAGDADVIAEIEQLRERVFVLAERVLTDVDLNARAAIGEDEEARLAEAADADDAASRHGFDALGLERLLGALAVSLGQRRDGVRRRRSDSGTGGSRDA